MEAESCFYLSTWYQVLKLFSVYESVIINKRLGNAQGMDEPLVALLSTRPSHFLIRYSVTVDPPYSFDAA